MNPMRNKNRQTQNGAGGGEASFQNTVKHPDSIQGRIDQSMEKDPNPATCQDTDSRMKNTYSGTHEKTHKSIHRLKKLKKQS